MNVKELKAILAHMSDDALVLARGCDCINLDMVDVVGIKDPGLGGASYHETVDTVYGGKDWVSEMPPSGQAIIFCEMD